MLLKPYPDFCLGASSSRRDFGRGYTAPQWARYLNRELCAESMEKFVRTAALPGVSLADILADPRTLMKDIENSGSSSSRSKRRSNKSPARLKDMLKKKSSVLYSKVFSQHIHLYVYFHIGIYFLYKNNP